MSFHRRVIVPKVFTEEQKQAMKRKLISIGFKIFSEYGIRKSRVEDITRQAGIAKGTFYSFFPFFSAPRTPLLSYS